MMRHDVTEAAANQRQAEQASDEGKALNVMREDSITLKALSFFHRDLCDALILCSVVPIGSESG